MATKIQYFTVAGDGEFPLDMLRHGRAWPTSSEDTCQMQGVHHRAVMLCSLDEPDWGRWHSFGWKKWTIQPMQSYRRK